MCLDNFGWGDGAGRSGTFRKSDQLNFLTSYFHIANFFTITLYKNGAQEAINNEIDY